MKFLTIQCTILDYNVVSVLVTGVDSSRSELLVLL